jgi:hypothetical protein
MPRLLIFSSILCIYQFCFGQAPIGDWTYYGSYNTMQVLEIVGHLTYIGNDHGAFFVADPNTNETTKLSKIQGFVDAKVTYLEYSQKEKILVITYVNGQIDLLKGNQILNVNDIYRNENISTSKRINHIIIRDQLAYLSTDFGVVVLDITTGLIKETYRFIGTDGTQVEVYSSAIKEKTDSLFIVSNEGVQTASLLNNNLQDFHNWKTHDFTNQLPTEELVDVAILNDTVFLASITGIHTLENNVWKNQSLTSNSIARLTQEDNQLLYCYADTVTKITSSNQMTHIVSSLFSTTSMARIDLNGDLNVADAQNGLVVAGSSSISHLPNGPRYIDAFRIKHFEEKITVLSGGYSDFTTPANSTKGYYEYTPLTWTSKTSGKDFPLVTDLVSAAHNPTTGLTYYASFGDGLLMKNGEDYELFNHENSPLDTATDGKVYVADIQTDIEGNTWVTNYNTTGSSKYLHKIDLEGVWTSFRTFNSTGRSALEFVIDNNNVKWIQVRVTSSTRNLLVYDPEEGTEKLLTTSSADLPGPVNCLDINDNGNIYIGTDNGIAISYDPQNVFTTSGFTVSKPILGEQYLLQDEVVNAIKVDGGGRLWAGTNSGLFLFSADFGEQLAFFNPSNSPLLSNVITAIEINGETGEVFASTAEGVFSFMGDATEATSKNKSSILIYPNPVRPEYTGVVAIRGLVKNANVKITDINTNLVYESTAEGGTATWNMNLLSGERATTGVYLIFASDEQGKETFVGKLAIISQ